jgi:hypothetical protein
VRIPAACYCLESNGRQKAAADNPSVDVYYICALNERRLSIGWSSVAKQLVNRHVDTPSSADSENENELNWRDL